ncbi:MAG: hypothetical protein PHP23_07455 [Desulfobacterales bacterium]|nr:hypothetical protein [Desulfobacterales bacterium]MDD4071777.1 hypothetical protein [Desulfobacterales bacterium]MDD4393663.1 hypothetical protein [Desulfobacterales bacterium]
MNESITEAICGFVKSYKQKEDIATEWQMPLVGFADAADPLFDALKDAVSPSHSIPYDIMADARTVVAFFLPFDRDITGSNISGEKSSRQWAMAYIETNQLICDLNQYLKKWFQAAGYDSSIIPATHNFDTTTLISDWSHRHVGFIAGLGRFGLNNMLITESGCCGRFGSIVTNCPTAPSPRPGEEYCLYRHNGTCAKCVDRCACHALTKDGYDRHRCYEVLLANDAHHSDLAMTDVCGKCTVGLPCSCQNPVTPCGRK